MDAELQALLLELARESIVGALDAGVRLEPRGRDWPATLDAHGASFVTLTTRGGSLRGCCGSIIATRPLAEDVWRNAQRTAFDDPRFPELTRGEITGCALAISVLGPLQPMIAETERALEQRLRPGEDGVLLRRGERQATFLPKVWEKLPTAPEFLAQLKCKMGLPGDFWDQDMQAWRYTTVEFSGALEREVH